MSAGRRSVTAALALLGGVALAAGALAQAPANPPAVPPAPASTTAAAPAAAALTPGEPVPPYETFTLDSKAVGEPRRINVYTPPGYADGGRFGVLYMPDGGIAEDFPHVASDVDAAIRAGEMKPMIVVGIENTQRRRDMTGPTEVEEDRKIAPVVGGSQAFRAFVRDELMPYVAQRYRTNDETAMIGESLAGLFTLETFLAEPGLLDTAIVLSPSLWWNAEALVNGAEQRLREGGPSGEKRNHGNWSGTLYVATASDDGNEMAAGTLVGALRAAAPVTLRWFVEPRADLQHANIYRGASPALFRRFFPPAGAPVTREAVLSTPWFRFHSDFRFNLWDAVLTAATARNKSQADPLVGQCFAGLVLEERNAWTAAVAYFAQTVANTADFSRERYVVRMRLAGIPVDMDDDDRRDLDLSLLFLDAAARAWRACAWAEQDAANRKWIAALAPRLERHADAIGHRIEEIYGVKWRQLPIEVDVVGTAGWAGADTVAANGLPTHTQVSSRNPDYAGDHALEMVFHEASHELVSPRNGAVARLLADAAAAEKVEVDRNLWHALLFVTAGEVTRDELARSGVKGYDPISEAVVGRAWKPLLAPLHEHWVPFVLGKGERTQAARDLVRAIAAPK